MYFVGRTCPRAPGPAAASVPPSSAGPTSLQVTSRRHYEEPHVAPPIADYFTRLPAVLSCQSFTP